jgi:hypothetical protein
MYVLMLSFGQYGKNELCFEGARWAGAEKSTNDDQKLAAPEQAKGSRTAGGVGAGTGDQEWSAAKADLGA